MNYNYNPVSTVKLILNKICKLLLFPIIKPVLLIFPINKNKIVCDNFLGKGYGGNPKYIIDELLNTHKKYDIVWVVNDMKENMPKEIRVVKYGSIKAMYEFATAKIWIDNVRNSERIRKKREQFYIQTWHGGLGPKKIEGEIEEMLSKKYVRSAKLDGSICDAIIIANKFQDKQFKKSFWLNKRTKFLNTGLPCNDYYFKQDLIEKDMHSVKSYFNLTKDATVILYAPTFRDDNSTDGYKIDFENVLKAFEKKTNSECVLIVRLHPNAVKLADFIKYNDKIINGSMYPDVQKLCAMSDYLISDYSSIVFDFVILKKPVFICAVDIEKYSKMRPLNELFEEYPFPIAETGKELILNINNFDIKKYLYNISQFQKKFPSYDKGNASKQIAKLITKICM